jgi:hypothetical protein
MEASDLIIVGTRSDASKEEYPQIIEITAKEIFKGELTENPIRVESFTADCEYGVVITDDQDYIIFLKKREDFYTSVRQACGVITLLYEENKEVLEGLQATPAPEVQKDFTVFWAVAGILAGLGAFCGLARARKHR